MTCSQEEAIQAESRSVVSAGRLLDFWDEEIRLFGVAPAGEHIDCSLAEHRAINYHPKGIALDHADSVTGDLSLLYTPAAAGMPARFGFVAGLWGERWALSPEMTLRFWVKVEDDGVSGAWTIRLVDGAGREADGALPRIETGGGWQELALPLNAFRAPAAFDSSNTRLCEFEAAFSEAARIRLDGVRFEGAETVIGVTDKPLAQRLAEAEASRDERIRVAFQLSAQKDHSPAVSAFAKMYLDEDLDAANQMLAEELAKSAPDNHWSLLHTPLYCRFYYWFSNHAGELPGRLKPELEKQLLATLWERTAIKNDIHWAQRSTWWLDGSENHDLNAKACNLVTSRIFMGEPDYRDRVYPDLGFGGAYHYGHAGYYGRAVDPDRRHGGGRAELADGHAYTARDHYAAWLVYMKEYFRERARRGFFVENSAPGYSKHTLNMVDLAYQYSGDAELRQVIGDFLTLYWADWAQRSISGVPGGPKTRHHNSVGGYDSTSPIVSFYLGGPGSGAIWSYWNLLNDYRLPPVVWRMALDRDGMGSFVYRARGIGEEENVWPRPPGTERTLVCDTESRFLKYTYVTPDYTLATQMEHPAAVHSHLSCAGRWHGMTFAQDADAKIVPIGFPDKPDKKGELRPFDTECVFRTVQHEHTLILQQARSWLVANPDWFPGPESKYERRIGIHFGQAWDRREERDGWIFVQRGAAYAGVLPVLGDKRMPAKQLGTQKFFHGAEDAPTVELRTDTYSWNEDRTWIELEDRFSPVIIEAGRQADYPGLEDFMAAVLRNPIALYKAVVPGFNILVYTGHGDDAREIVFNAANCEIPTVGDRYIDYSYPMTFDSPYLQSNYKSGQVTIKHSDEELNLDFTETPTTEEKAPQT